MNRRDLLIFAGVIIWALWGYYHVNTLATSYDIILYFGLWFVVLCVYLVVMIVLSLVFPKFGKWGDTKLIKGK